MKKIISAVFAAVVLLAGCTKTYDWHYDSLYYTGPDGNTYCYMPQEYNIGSSAGKLPILVCYSGQWTATLDEGTSWAFVDRASGNGTGYIHVWYTGKENEEGRSVTLTISCSNGDSAEIQINQK